MSDLEDFDGGVSHLARVELPSRSDPESALALDLYRGMQLVRTVELAIESMHKAGRMSGSFHSSLGQEASAVGVCSALRESDIVTSTHRGHGHAVAKGVPVRGIFAELLGRSGGVSGGRGGSMHLHHRESGFYGETAIVAGGVAWAAGAAWARRRKDRDDIAVAFIGDGAFAQGVTHETLLLASHWSSPCLIVCENNGFAHSMSSLELFGEYGAIAERVAATGVEARYVDGRDVLAVADVSRALVSDLRHSARPAFLECGLYRVRPHSVSDADYRYRPKDAGASWLTSNDPILNLRGRLGPALSAELDRIDTGVRDLVASELAQAQSQERTAPAAARSNLYSTPELEGRA
jgi:TPP-dependent pyruvate/acetoin dehydrogenase alpha subunit